MGGAEFARFRGYASSFPDVFYSTVNLEASNETDYFVSSDGARVSTPSHVARLVVVGRTRAADGMDLFSGGDVLRATSWGGLPEQSVIVAKTLAMLKNLEALRGGSCNRALQRTGDFEWPGECGVLPRSARAQAGRAAAKKAMRKGQTFTKLLGKPILPTFMSVVDDPTVKDFNGIALSGHYVLRRRRAEGTAGGVDQEWGAGDFSDVADADCELPD